MSNEKNIRIVRGISRYAGSQNKDVSITPLITSDRRTLIQGERNRSLNLVDQFNEERGYCSTYRLYGKIDVLYNNIISGETYFNDTNYVQNMYFLPDYIGCKNLPCKGTPPSMIFDFIPRKRYGLTISTGDFTELGAYQDNWVTYISYIYSANTGQSMTYYSDYTGSSGMDFIAADGIPFHMEVISGETPDSQLVARFTCPVPHNIQPGEYIQLQPNPTPIGGGNIISSLDVEYTYGGIPLSKQEDIFKIVEPIFYDLFKEFGKGKKINKTPFPRIKYEDSMKKYGTDKPDLRNPIEINDVTKIFESPDVKLKIFQDIIAKGGVVKAIPASNTSSKPRSFFDGLNNWAISEGASGLAYITFEKKQNKIVGKGPIAKFFSDKAIIELIKNCKINEKDSVFFVCNKEKEATKFSGIARQKIGEELKLIDEKSYYFCWITDYPMYEYDEKEKKIDFSHNPFSMPQVDIKDFDKTDPLKILAYQYDLVCNGYELSSGAIRNHIPDYLFKVFNKVGYSKEMVEKNFSGMIKALSYGAPPHGGMAPGIDRIVMLLANQKNIREVTLFPLNQNAEDLLMEAPSEATEKQLKELNIKTVKKN